MVNFLSLLAARALPQSLERRGDTITTSFTTAYLTQYDDNPIGALLTVTVFGYVAPAIRVSNSITYTTLKSYTRSTIYPTLTTSDLTTVFTPSPFCFTEYSALYGLPAEATESDPRFQLPGPDRTECFPDGHYTISYYSPGICPQGYTLDRTSYTIEVTAGSAITESRGACCPTGYQYSTNQGLAPGCLNYINSSPTFNGKSASVSTSPLVFSPSVVTVEYTTGLSTTLVSYETNPAGTITIVTISSISTIPQLVPVTVSEIATIIAEPISIRWRSTDLEVVGWLAAQIGNGTNSTNSSPVPTPSHHKLGISGATVAEIVIGALAGLFLVGFGVRFFCRRARARKQKSAQADLTMNGGIGFQHNKGNGFPEYSGPYVQSRAPAELDSQTWHNGPTYYPQTFPTIISELPDTSNPQHVSLNSNMSDQSTVRVSTVSGFSPSLSQIPQSPADQRVSKATNPSDPATKVSSEAVGTITADVTATASSPKSKSTATTTRNSHAQALREQQIRIREERARLARLQELSEMDARLERELRDELDRERAERSSNQ